MVQQIEDGGPADVLVTADEKNMQKAVDAGLVDTPRDVGTNSLVLVVPKDNPKKISLGTIREDQELRHGGHLRPGCSLR